MNRRTIQLAMNALWLVPFVGLAGCLDDDSNPPVLSVQLYWETNRGREGTCSVAHVDSISWHLEEAGGERIVERTDERCTVGFDFPDVGPGHYLLEVTGKNADGATAWQGSCDLDLDRFDRLYDCVIGMVRADTPTKSTHMTDTEDAGT